MGFFVGVRRPSCPDCEALAAYIDHGLKKLERIQVEEHMAACIDCIALVAGAVRVVAELKERSAAVDPGPAFLSQ